MVEPPIPPPTDGDLYFDYGDQLPAGWFEVKTSSGKVKYRHIIMDAEREVKLTPVALKANKNSPSMADVAACFDDIKTSLKGIYTTAFDNDYDSKVHACMCKPI
eukprot:TRINITY_DN1521_c0_g3_i5.p2 TRINITY_DN1521_c0_g3~~TRINITY_DN1521_c0_g3_i5.p2  ORF type:complete len:104 (+),score=15.65 TRINITY_DN1521_c0_g3_i5:834-1145(+)